MMVTVHVCVILFLGLVYPYRCDNEPLFIGKTSQFISIIILSCSVAYMNMNVSHMFSSTNVGCSSQSEWELLSITPLSELGSKERVSLKKILRVVRKRQDESAEQTEARAEELQRRLNEERREHKKMLQQAMEGAQQAELKVQQERERVQRAVEEVQQTKVREQREKEALGQRVRQADKRARQMEEKVQHEKENVQRTEEGVRQERERVQQAENRAQQAEDRVQQAEAIADELKRRLDEVEGKEHEMLAVQLQAITAEQRGPSWEVGEEDLQLTGEVIGIGGWAEVRVAHLKVAAKKLHSQLVYDYHRQLFQREMAVAARVSHPNLLRFHGAKLEGGMTILTELMPTSLRAEVERGHRHPEHCLSLEHILSIAMDVACALNYLHHLIPDPVIHRDLSSANVLLKPTPNGGWLAKVSDYGSANFQQRLQTQNPGSPVYAAPESHNPALQSPKMDIFSFGVLLIEMCTCDFPEPERRPDLIESIRYPQLVRLIRWCLNEDRNQRPTAAQVIDYLRTLQ